MACRLGDALEQSGAAQGPGEVDDVGANRLAVDVEHLAEVIDQVGEGRFAVEEAPHEPGSGVEDQGLAVRAEEHGLGSYFQRDEVGAEVGNEPDVDVVRGDDGVDVSHGAWVGPDTPSTSTRPPSEVLSATEGVTGLVST